MDFSKIDLPSHDSVIFATVRAQIQTLLLNLHLITFKNIEKW